MISKWQAIRRLREKIFQAAFFIEDSKGVTLKDQDAILKRWREHFSDLLNSVDAATSTQIHEEQVGEDIQITEADVNAVVKSQCWKQEDFVGTQKLRFFAIIWLDTIESCKALCNIARLRNLAAK